MVSKSAQQQTIAKASVKLMRERLFKDRVAPLLITVGILSADVPNVKTVVERGELVPLSPDEMLMAFWEEFRDRKANAGWDTAARSTDLTICSLANESDFWNVASNSRELISDTHAALGKTALGRIYELIYVKKHLEAKPTGSSRVTPKVLLQGVQR